MYLPSPKLTTLFPLYFCRLFVNPGHNQKIGTIYRFIVFDPPKVIVFKQKNVKTHNLQTLVSHVARYMRNTPDLLLLDKVRKENPKQRRPIEIVRNRISV